MMQANLNLDGYHTPNRLYFDHAGFKTGGASYEAAAQISSTLKDAHQKLLFLLKLFPNGLTSDQCATKLDWRQSYARPRMSELHKRGLVKEVGRDKNPDTKKSVTIWGLV